MTGGLTPSVAAQMSMMTGGGIGLGQVIGPPGQGNDGMDPFDRELQMRIEKMRKKRASIPPFVQKLSRYVSLTLFLSLCPFFFFFLSGCYSSIHPTKG